jgi:oligopeptidase B
VSDGAAASVAAAPTGPPVARRDPQPIRHHGDTRVDPYRWLEDADDPEVIAHLEAENAWTAAATEPLASLRAAIFTEIKDRVLETDLSVPVRDDDWWYYSRTVEGLQYAIHCRRPVDPSAPTDPEAGGAEQVLLDENAEAGDAEFFDIGAFDVTPDHTRLAWSLDVTGGERFELRVRDLATGTDLADRIPDTYYSTAWSADGRVLFYVRPDEAMRPYQLWRHVLGTPADDDVLVLEESDERFFLTVAASKDDRWLVAHLGSKTTDEEHILAADDPYGAWRIVEPRTPGVEYSLEHHAGRFLIVTNADDAEDFKLVEAPTDAPGRANWREVIPHRPGTTIKGVEVFAGHVVVAERSGGLRQIRVRRWRDGTWDDAAEHVIEQPEAVGTAVVGENPSYDSTTLRYGWTSMVTPSTVYDYDLDARTRVLRKQQPVLGDFDPAHYATERVWAPADDGTLVPVTLVRRREVARDGTAALVLYGYGSYETSIDPTFSIARLSLLDRGVVFAVAHVRGGGELGRRWYLDGKLEHKANTFTDFVAAARHLVAEGWAAPDRVAIRGGSAGGLLVGAAVNLAPDLFRAAVAEVPFVDALTTMLDPSLPLTVTEWEEWGNPLHDADAYATMKSYAPYDNLVAGRHPRLLVTAGLHDPRVSYWEPAKYVAKLRELDGVDAPVLLKTEMGAGHMGPSGRYDAWRDEAFTLSFVLDALDATELLP